MAAQAGWRRRLDGLGLSTKDKARAIVLVLKHPEHDRDLLVDEDPEVARATVRRMLADARKAGVAGEYSPSPSAEPTLSARSDFSDCT